MRKLAIILGIFLGGITASAQSVTPAAVAQSPAERAIAQANAVITKNARDFEGYNALALALSRRARETSDVAYYNQAEAALQKSFAISPGNFDGAKIHVWLLLGKHEFAAALEEATRLNRKIPDDVTLYGFLTDANVELGNYKEAEGAAQWMLDLRPGNLPALTRAAYLRELFGDSEGSFQLMDMALQSTPLTEVEDRAWIVSQMAHLKLSGGKTDEAERLSQQALAMFPGYHYALGNLAKVRIQQKRYPEAVGLLQQRYQAASHAENLYDLAEALQLAGRSSEAAKAFAEFEQKSLAETNRADNSNHELIYYYADHAKEPAKALEVARREFARRHDCFTLESLAWALYVNGQYSEAQERITQGLAVGIRDGRMFRHAGEIALKAGDRRKAEQYLQEAAGLSTVESPRASALLAAMHQAN